MPVFSSTTISRFTRSTYSTKPKGKLIAAFDYDSEAVWVSMCCWLCLSWKKTSL